MPDSSRSMRRWCEARAGAAGDVPLTSVLPLEGVCALIHAPPGATAPVSLPSSAFLSSGHGFIGCLPRQRGQKTLKIVSRDEHSTPQFAVGNPPTFQPLPKGFFGQAEIFSPLCNTE